MLRISRMGLVRRRLSWLLSFWLVCQAVSLAAPVVLAATGATAEELCTCPGGDHETCPMHHGQANPDGTTALCGMRAGCAPIDIALLSLAGGAGVLPTPVHVVLLRAQSAVVTLEPAEVSLAVPHDTPPPRRS